MHLACSANFERYFIFAPFGRPRPRGRPFPVGLAIFHLIGHCRPVAFANVLAATIAFRPPIAFHVFPVFFLHSRQLTQILSSLALVLLTQSYAHHFLRAAFQVSSRVGAYDLRHRSRPDWTACRLNDLRRNGERETHPPTWQIAISHLGLGGLRATHNDMIREPLLPNKNTPPCYGRGYWSWFNSTAATQSAAALAAHLLLRLGHCVVLSWLGEGMDKAWRSARITQLGAGAMRDGSARIGARASCWR